MRSTVWNVIIALAIVIIAAIAVVALTNEEAADEVDQAAEDLREAGSDLGDAAENLGDAAEITGEEISGAAEETGIDEAAEEAGEEISEEAANLAEEGGDIIEEETDNLAADNSVMDVLNAQADLSTFVQVINSANLAGDLDDDNPITVFAPTNAAFAAVPNLNTLLQDSAALQRIVNGHLVDGEITSAEIGGTQSVTTRGGNMITISATQQGIVLNNSVQVIIIDLQASNGVVHVVDAVIVR